MTMHEAALIGCREVLKAWQQASRAQQKHWSTAANACAYAVRLADEAAKHVHVNNGDGTDSCKACGKDLRDDIHIRMSKGF